MKGLGLLVLLFLATRGTALVGVAGGNRWFAIRYRWSGVAQPVWGSPMWTDEFRALQLKPVGPSEVWTWNGATWERRA